MTEGYCRERSEKARLFEPNFKQVAKVVKQQNKMTVDFLNQQLLTVAPFSTMGDLNGQFRIKITSDRGETKWMNINNAQFQAVELALEENL